MEEVLCPSAPPEPGGILVGIVQEDGRVGFVSTPLRVDEDFVREVEAEGEVARRYRFATPCVEGRCNHWRGGRCRVSDAAAASAEVAEPDGSLPHCGIRSSCRWFRQSGEDACRTCALVITEVD
jgi:hypothetical protein